MKTVCCFLLASALSAAPLAGQDTVSAPVDTSYVEYHDSPISLPLGVGFRVPSYDRVNGVTLPWGPRLVIGEEKILVDALVSYRSNLGKWDPSLEGTLRPGYANEIKVFVGRGTFTNDAWIRSDLMNSLAALFVGSDARNYYRADRAAVRFTRSLTTSSLTLTPFIGGNIENDWSTGSLVPEKSPWSFFGRTGDLKMRRPNPPVVRRHIGSILAGGGIEYFREGVDAKVEGTFEHALQGPETTCIFTPGGPFCPERLPGFNQTTLHSHAEFPTFGLQTFEFRGHAVLTGGTATPPQRFAYLGGAGTLATVNLLALGGDRLLYVEGDYKIPLRLFQLPFLGSPFVALRYAAGNAGIGKLPPLIQNIGIGAGVGMIRVDYAIDPASERNPLSRRSAFSVGMSLSF